MKYEYFIMILDIEYKHKEGLKFICMKSFSSGSRLLIEYDYLINFRQYHCGMRDKSSMFLSPLFKNLIFLCSFFNAELNGTIRILYFRWAIIDLLLWATVVQ